MKPEELTKQTLQEYITACKQLLKWYEHGKKDWDQGHLNDCPLCMVALNVPRNGVVSMCHGSCLWVMFTKADCEDYMDNHFDIKGASVTLFKKQRHPEWTKLRIKQLKQWIKKLEKALAKKEV